MSHSHLPTQPMVLDQAMPTWWQHEVHSIPLPPSHGDVMEAADKLTWGEVPFFHGLLTALSLGLRRLPDDVRVLALFEHGGYAVIHRSPDELLAAGLLRLSTRHYSMNLGDDPVVGFRRLAEPGVKVALNFLSRDGMLRTETRVQPTTRAAKAVFLPYWAGVRVGGGLIRRSWLRGIRQRSILQ
ncbi:MAG: hypothetical protein LBV00_06440 [Propionibacteriaceae bacterium]|nr:hypothetical protein [Propionibacteriaceae bacterium]